MSSGTLTVNDTAPDLTGSVNTSIVGAAAVVHVKRPDGTVLSKAATITSGATGDWSSSWATGDLNTAGRYLVEVEVTFSNGKVQTFALDDFGDPVEFLVREQYA